jgi:hypothetical protein
MGVLLDNVFAIMSRLLALKDHTDVVYLTVGGVVYIPLHAYNRFYSLTIVENRFFFYILI